LNLILGRLITKPTVDIAIITNVETKKEKLKMDKTRTKKKVKTKPKIILKFIF
jgi:hypothetical protein